MTRRGGNRLFCFGLGYSAMALVKLLPTTNWHISGTVRTSARVRELAANGIRGGAHGMIEATQWDGGAADDQTISLLARASHILISVPPGETGDAAFNAGSDIIAAVDHVRWLGYLSTTGVYGNTNGRLVDETAVPDPSSQRAKRRIDAEAGWLSLFKNHQTPGHIFRLAGIYGPGRSVFDRIRRGDTKRIDKPGHVFSRIHVDDIAKVLAASIAAPDPGTIYNVCDDEPAAPAEVMAYACGLLGVDSPEAVDFEIAKKTMTPMALSFWTDNRRVENQRIRDELGVELAYPDYRTGLRAVLKSGG